jgi:hypothetical protein
VIPISVLFALTAVSASAAVPPGCAGSASLGAFQLSVRPFSQGEPLPLKSVAEISGGSRLIWNPVHLLTPLSDSAEVAAVLVPAADGDLITLEPRKATAATEWQLPERPQVIALLFGPQGLSEGKIKALVTHNPELLRELADYAEQSSEVESLVQQLGNAEQSGSGPAAVLKGFSSQYGVGAPKLDTKASSDQQAALLLKALMPASSAYDPLTAKTAQVQQTGGVAASLAGMFFGNPVALAAGGATLFQNLKTTMFPGTDFRSAFAQISDQNQMALCTKNLAAKSKMRSAYLWAYRVPEVKRPAVNLEGSPHLPVGSKSAVTVKLGAGSTIKDLALAREWRLAPAGGGPPVGVDVRFAAPDSLEIDLSRARPAAGDYHLAAAWDWDTLPVSGVLHLHPYDDFSHATLAVGERDKLIEGRGVISVKLAGADFEFLEKAALGATEAGFILPKGKRSGPQDSVRLNLDTAKRGSYQVLLTQSDGVPHELAVTVLPPNPKISNLPVRLNAGEIREPLQLRGSGLERIEGMSSEAGTISGAPDSQGWSGEIAFQNGVARGKRFSLILKVEGLENPVVVPDAIEMVGPRPRIESVRKSLAGGPGIEIGADELPAGTTAGLVFTVDQPRDASRPRLELGCERGELRQALTLAPGEPSATASLTFAGPAALYLSVDPGAIGYAGCRLTAVVIQDPEGRSAPFLIGRVIRVPRLDKFTLTSEKVGDASYAGAVEGRDLDVIEKAGWDAQNGVPVESIPTPVPGDSARQTLRVVLPWPAPAPHAPLYVWLRGESQGRKTPVTY